MSLSRKLFFIFLLQGIPLIQLLQITTAQEWESFDEDYLVQLIQPHPCSNFSADSSEPTLNEVLFNLTFGQGNSSLLLQPGEHCIQTFVVVRDIEDLSIIGNGSATIRCRPGVGFAFYNMSGLFLSNLIIDDCGMDLYSIGEFLDAVKTDIDFFWELENVADQYIAVGVGNSRDFVMVNCSVTNRLGLGLLGINLVGQSLLDEVTFASNGVHSCLNEYNETTENVGGGALFAYHDYLDFLEGLNVTATTLNITNSKFVKNLNCGYSNMLSRFITYVTLSQDFPQQFTGGGGGMSVQLTQLQYGVLVNIADSVFTRNTGTLGSGAYVAIYTAVTCSQVIFTQCNFSFNGNIFSTYQQAQRGPVFGSAIGIVFDYVQPNFSIESIIPFFNSTNLAASVTAENCIFHNNFAYTGTVTVLSLLNFVVPLLAGRTVSLDGCLFRYNLAVLGPAISALEQKFNPYKPGTSLTLKDITIMHNKLIKKQKVQSPSDASGIIHLINFKASFAGNNTLEHNDGSALKMDSSLALFHDNITFLNNSATYGGAIQAYDSSYAVFMENATAHFISNTAGVSGGAIYIHFSNIYPDPLGNCFLNLGVNPECSRLDRTNCSDITTLGVQLTFVNNEASLGGTVYGSTLEECLWVANFRKNHMLGLEGNRSIFEIFYDVQQNTSGEYTFKSPFVFDRPPDNLAQVATPVMQLNASDSENMGPVNDLTLAPGITKNIKLAAYDGFNWLVPATVTSKASKSVATSVLGRNFVFIEYNSTRNASLYLLTLTNDVGANTTVTLFTTESFSADWTITVTFEDCPDGFYFDESNRKCTCYKELQDKKVYCTEDGRLLGPVNTWVGEDNNGSLNLVTCPFDYCRRSISVLEGVYDSQCNPKYNRSGLGCGRCLQNLSLTLGSNVCSKCSNGYLLLILLFALYGILLIWLLMHTKFTISGGFLNGILFFSNILSLYAPIHTSGSVFVVFSWLSLKVGFRTCFYDGMKPLDIAALNFVFPAYLFLILLLVYVAADRSSRFSSWLSRRCCTPTHLFVTITVMTYSSVLESCILALSATTVTVFINENVTETSVRWRYDPSQRYFHGFHGALASFSVIILVFFLIPAPLICMLNVFGRHFMFLSRYKPFFDAIWAPLKPKFRFWVSLRMLFRIFPLIFFYLVPSPYHLFLLELFLLVTSFVHGMVQPYTGMAQNVFDGFLQLILTTITLVSFFYTVVIDQLGESDDLEHINEINTNIYVHQASQYVVITVLVALAYVVGVVMFCWHLWTAFPKERAKLRDLSINLWYGVVSTYRRKLADRHVELTRTVLNNDDSSTSSSNNVAPYGSTLQQVVREPTTFSELREPLLEDSTSAVDIISCISKY